MSEIITSKQNQYVKMAKSLHLKKFREKQDAFLIEGVRLVEEAASCGWNLKFVLYNEKLLEQDRGTRLLRQLQSRGVSTWQVTGSIFNDTAETETPQGILAAAQMKFCRMDDINAGADGLVLVIDGVQDPGNLGTMIRTACAAGASGVILLKGTADPFNSKVVRSSMGALFHLPVVRDVSYPEAAEFLKNNTFQVLTADLSGDDLFSYSHTGRPTAWVLGNEANGPDKYWIDHADKVVKIPLAGPAESLNVAVAAGILLYDTVRQRYK